MSKVSRRDVLKASAGLGLGAAVTGCATAGQGGDANLVLAAPPVVTVPVINSAQRFPVRRIYCAGRGDLMVCGIDKVGELHVKVV